MSDFKHQTFDIIRQLTGHENIITLNVAFVDFVNDLECGLFLSQLIYWSDRGTRKDGFIFKSDKEWHDELRLSKYAVRKSKKKLTELGILETKIKKAYGNPTTHYKLNKEAFVDQFTWFLRNQQKENTDSENGNDENTRSLTEITTDIKNRDYKNNKGTEQDSVLCFSFNDFKNKFSVKDDAIECIEYYLSFYQEYRNVEHPRLNEEQWYYVVNNLFYVDDFDLSDTNVMNMMEQHFKTKYKNCDYNILHFMSNGVRLNRMYEVAY
ncbi:hypothetical protein QF028_004362 [Neobacillus sp. B4I6]|uniref:hypothetical protein n=1 Tax=Neobacillus sp. B4I6 TaxID=3373925 RepID=UPI003D223F14